MASRTETYTTRIFINAEEAKKQLEELTHKTENLRRKKEAAAAAGDWKTFNKTKRQLDDTLKEIDKIGAASSRIEKTLDNLSTASVKEINKTIRAINGELRSGAIERNSEEWNFLNEQLARCKAELKGIKDESEFAKGIQPSETGFLKTFNNIGFAVNNVIGMVRGLKDLFDKIRGFADPYVAEFLKIDTAMTNVRKYTGQTMDEVRAMNETFKQMDTATSREELNALAGSAGRLGITSKEAIEEFVSAADTIKIALGDDLGDGAVDQIGKLAMAFGEDEKMGLRGAMLATGSAVNELAQNSAANAGYLVDFTARVAGAARQLGMSQADIMGFGAAMDENLLRDEMAATAFANMLTKMATDTDKFAKIAGKNAKEFADLVKNDVNGAVLALADNLNRQDSNVMLKMLNDMGLDGSRAVSVLSTLASKIDDVRKHQETANEAYREGVSIQKEANLQNQSNERQLMKIQKQISDIYADLGNELYPVIINTTKASKAAAEVVLDITRYVKKHASSIIRLATEFAVLTAVIKANTIAQIAGNVALNAGIVLEKAWLATTAATKAVMTGLSLAWTLCTKGVQAYTVALNAAKAASMTNPYLALITVLLTVGTTIYELTNLFGKNEEAVKKASEATNDFSRTQHTLKEVQDEASASVAEEKLKFEQLRKTLEDNKRGYDERKRALGEIKKIVPEYHGKLTSENKLINSNTEALDGYVTNLLKAARATAAFNKMVKLQESSMSHEQTLSQREGNQRWAQKKLSEMGATTSSRFEYKDFNVGYAMYDEQGKFVKYVDAAQKKQIEHYQKLHSWNEQRINEEKQILALNEKQSNALQKIVDEGKSGSTKTTKSTTPYVSDEEKKKREREQKEREKALQKEIRERDKQLKAETDQKLATETMDYSLGLTTYKDYLEKRKQIQIEGIRERKKLYTESSAEFRRLDAQEKMLLVRGDAEAQKLSMAEMDRQHQAKMAKIRASFNDINSANYQNEEAMNEALFEEDMAYLERKRSKYHEGSLEWIKIGWEIEDLNQKHQLEQQQLFQEKLSYIRENLLGKSNDKIAEIELKALDELHKKQLISEEEFQRAKLAIQAKYAQDPAKQNTDAVQQKVSNALTVAQSKAGDANTENPWTGDITNYARVNEQLKALYKEDQLTYSEYIAAKASNLSDFLDKVVAKYGVVFDQAAAVYNGINAYAKASSEYEIAATTKKYDAEIKAAGNNQRKVKKLEAQKQKEIAAIKSKANARAMRIEIAQAIASTALGAINAYTSAAQVPLIGYIIAPIAAAAAVAAGMLQIATIKKQHDTEALGYYEGGYTGGKRYRKEAGVVHEGEFVANHQAVNNPNIRPMLDFIDQAQRNNTVGSLSRYDLQRNLGSGQPVVVQPNINVSPDNSTLEPVLGGVQQGIDRLNKKLDDGIDVIFVMDEFDKEHRHFQKMKNR